MYAPSAPPSRPAAGAPSPSGPWYLRPWAIAVLLCVGTALLVAATVYVALWVKGRSTSPGTSGPAISASATAQPTPALQPTDGQVASASVIPLPGPPAGLEGYLTREELGYSTIAIPPLCAAYAQLTGPDEGKVAFSNGVAESVAGPAQVSIKDVQPTKLPGGALTAVVFTCRTPDGDVQDSLAIYDANANLVGQLELFWGPDMAMLPAAAPIVTISNASFTNAEAHLLIPSLSVAPAEGALAGQEALGHVIARFEGGRFVHQETYYEHPLGTWQQPNVAQLQAFYDDIAAGRDERAAPHTTQQNMDDVRTGCLGCEEGQSNYRSAVFPPGGVVEQCVLAGELGVPLQAIDGTAREVPMEMDLRAGDFFCGVLRPGQKPEEDGVLRYPTWLIVRQDRGGDFFVPVFGRSFS
ncbi:MAG: hypothetical protein Q3999_02985 [Buchananella hordeovulneris]|nr:hypothetical protein [Buchananella hordeovulneris]